jgi:preprotein translocase subunit SecA
VDEALSRHRHTIDELAKWAAERFARPVAPEELADEQTRRDVLLQKGRSFLRTELTQLERFVLLQILDQAWKDHLYSMDQLKDSVGLRGYAEKDPRIEYKREGARQFVQMQQAVRERVTDLIFRAKLTPNVQARSVYRATEARHDEAAPAVGGRGPAPEPAAAAARSGSDEQQADLEAAQRAGSGENPNLSRRQRRARAAAKSSEASDNRPKVRKRKHR